MAVTAAGLLLTACASADSGAVVAGASPAAAITASPDATSTPTQSATASAWLCAELPERDGVAPANDLEGFFNATPADADGNVLYDPSDWGDAQMIEHPRVALVDTDTDTTITSYDRVSCAIDDPDYVPPAIDPTWPANSVAIVDMDTGQAISFSKKYN